MPHNNCYTYISNYSLRKLYCDIQLFGQ